MTSEDMVEDPLISFQFYKNNKSFFISCYSPSTVFFFIAKDAWICISTTLRIFKTKPWHKLFHDIWDTVEDPLMSVQFYIKSNSFIVTCYSPSTVFTFIAKEAWICISTTLWIFKTKPWHKLFDDIWDTVEDPLMSVQFYIKSNSFIVTCYIPSTVFTFIAKEAWICISTSLWIFKTKPWHKIFDDIWRHGCRSVDECSILYKQ